MQAPPQDADWGYSPDHYEAMLKNSAMEIRTDPVRGKALFATRAFEKGDIVHVERSLVVAQDVDSAKAGVIVCDHCLTSLETPHAIALRCVGSTIADKLPHLDLFPGANPIFPCQNEDSGCTAAYCSEECRDAAFDLYHAEMCIGELPGPSAMALHAYQTHNWIADRVDCADGHKVILRAVAVLISASRREVDDPEYVPLNVGLAAHRMLARSPLTEFTLTHLYQEAFDTDTGAIPKHEDDEAKRLRWWLRFAALKDVLPKDNPMVLYARTSTSQPPVAVLLADGYRLMKNIFELDDDEAAQLSLTEWSLMLGGNMRNAHSKKPAGRCSFDEYREWLIREHPDDWRVLQTELKSEAVHPRAFESGLSASGIYGLAACMNHDCDPNAMIDHNRRLDGQLCLTALRRIEAGDELNISYCERTDSVFTRQQHLFEQYRFTCDCKRCQRELAELGQRVLTDATLLP